LLDRVDLKSILTRHGWSGVQVEAEGEFHCQIKEAGRRREERDRDRGRIATGPRWMKMVLSSSSSSSSTGSQLG
jgi:hypothetical protein